jgi:hypothetical protein
MLRLSALVIIAALAAVTGCANSASTTGAPAPTTAYQRDIYDPLLHAGSGATKRFLIVGVTEGCKVKLGADCEDVEEAGRPGRRGALGSEA